MFKIIPPHYIKAVIWRNKTWQFSLCPSDGSICTGSKWECCVTIRNFVVECFVTLCVLPCFLAELSIFLHLDAWSRWIAK